MGQVWGYSRTTFSLMQNHLSLDNRYGWGWDDNDQFLGGIILGYVAEGPSPLPAAD